MAVKPNIELHIEELVLHGFAGNERWSIADAVRAELESRLTERGLPNAQEIHVDRLDAGTVAGTNGRTIGAALHSTIGGEDVPPRR